MIGKPDLNKPAFSIFKKERKSIEKGICPFCGSKIKKKEFRDPTSEKEYSISGLCQKCQDLYFAGC